MGHSVVLAPVANLTASLSPMAPRAERPWVSATCWSTALGILQAAQWMSASKMVLTAAVASPSASQDFVGVMMNSADSILALVCC